MRYLDPIKILGGPIDATALKTWLLRQISDLELEGKESLLIEGQEISIQDLRQWLDECNDPTAMAYHERVQQQPVLLAALTHPDSGSLLSLSALIFGKDEAFQAFCSPYLAAAIARHLKDSILQLRWDQAQRLIAKFPLILEADHELALAPMRAHVQEESATLQHQLERESIFYQSPVFQTALDIGFLGTLNSLPAAFQENRNALALLLADLAIKMTKDPGRLPASKATWEAAGRIRVDAATSLKLQQLQNSLRQAVVNASQIQNLNHGLSSTKPQPVKRSTSGYWVVGIVGAILLLLVIGYAATTLAEAQKRRIQRSNDWLDQLNESRMESDPWDEDELDTEDYGEEYDEEFEGDFEAQEPPLPPFDVPESEALFAWLRKPPKYNAKVSELREPATGEDPYELFIGEETSKRGRREFTITNRSTKDIVVFVDMGEGTELVRSYYVKGKRWLRGEVLPPGNYRTSIYTGEGWTDRLGQYQGRWIGGFTKHVDRIGTLLPNGKSATTFDWDWPTGSTVVSHFAWDGEKLFLK